MFVLSTEVSSRTVGGEEQCWWWSFSYTWCHTLSVWPEPSCPCTAHGSVWSCAFLSWTRFGTLFCFVFIKEEFFIWNTIYKFPINFIMMFILKVRIFLIFSIICLIPFWVILLFPLSNFLKKVTKLLSCKTCFNRNFCHLQLITAPSIESWII